MNFIIVKLLKIKRVHWFKLRLEKYGLISVHAMSQEEMSKDQTFWPTFDIVLTVWINIFRNQN